MKAKRLLEDIAFCNRFFSAKRRNSYIVSDEHRIIAAFSCSFSGPNEISIDTFAILDQCMLTNAVEELKKEIFYWHPYLTHLRFRGSAHPDIENSCAIPVMKIALKQISPMQLTISQEKLQSISEWVAKPDEIIVSVVSLKGKTYITDGHTRAVCALQKGWTHIYCFQDPEPPSTFRLSQYVQLCEKQGIKNISDLLSQIVSKEEHFRRWISICQNLPSTPSS